MNNNTYELETYFNNIFKGVIEENAFDKGYVDGLKGVSNSDDAEYKKAWDLAQEYRSEQDARSN